MECVKAVKKKTRAAFGADMWHNGQNKKRKMICLACGGLGKSLHDIDLYTCERCGLAYGHLNFVKHDLGNHKRSDRMHRKTKLLCIDCKLSVRQKQDTIKNDEETEARADKTLTHNKKGWTAEHKRKYVNRKPGSVNAKICAMVKARIPHFTIGYPTSTIDLCLLMKGGMRLDGHNKCMNIPNTIFVHRRMAY